MMAPLKIHDSFDAGVVFDECVFENSFELKIREVVFNLCLGNLSLEQAIKDIKGHIISIVNAYKEELQKYGE